MHGQQLVSQMAASYLVVRLRLETMQEAQLQFLLLQGVFMLLQVYLVRLLILH